MRVAALYDIHGNLPGLSAVLTEVNEAAPDLVVIGGDVISGPQPAEVLEAVLGIDHPLAFVRGNGDRDPDEFEASILEPPELAAVAGWPTSATVEIDGLGATLFCHATPRDDRELITAATPDDVLHEVLAGVAEHTVVCGHTHSQYDRAAAGHRIVNAGAVGMPYEGVAGYAFWCLLGPGVELRRTAYDAAELDRALAQTGYPHPDYYQPHTAAEATAEFERQAGRG